MKIPSGRAVPCKDEMEENEREERRRALASERGNFLMSENVADIRATALGKWDELLVKNTIEFSRSLSPASPGSKNGGEKKREKVNIELWSIAFSNGVKF